MQVAVAGQGNRPYLEALDKQQIITNVFMKITVLWGIKLRIHHIIDVFIIYCGEGRRHTSVFSRVQSCPMYCLPTFELRRLLSGPAGNLIYCINLVTLCIYNKVISLHILFNHFLLICTGFCSLF